MAVASSRARTEHGTRLQWREQEAGSPERTKLWTEPKPRPRKAAVVYYLSRNGHLEHPHFMEVSLSSPDDGLYLRDVISRLDALRGKGMARMYSWSSKRSYKNGFVWHDLAVDDCVHPVSGHEYVLKGTELLGPAAAAAAALSSCSGSQETPTSSSSGSRATELAARRKKKADAWSSRALGEYMVYKSEETAAPAADAATQTDDHRLRQRGARARAQEELDREETSPPPPSSPSPETIEALIKADCSVVPRGAAAGVGRTRASSVLMQLISCGSISVKGGHSMPVAAQYRLRLPPRATLAAGSGRALTADAVGEMPSFRRNVVEDKEYFSGSLVETKRSSPETAGEFPVLRRSSSYNADRLPKVELPKGMEDLHDRCMPRKPKAKKEGYLVMSQRNGHGSKRFGER